MRTQALWMLSVVSLGMACRSADKAASTDTGGVVDGVTDGDGDGFNAAEDCDDNNPLVHPGSVEVCDGVDNNCDGIADEDVTTTFYADGDGDGFGDEGATVDACELPDGHVAVGNDCDDANNTVYPSAAERCDEIDNDCDGAVDEDVLFEWYADADGDGYGDPRSLLAVCDPPDGYVEDHSDCDDTNADALPGGEEICDEADNDCDGAVDEGVTTTYYVDTDGDQFGRSDATTEGCERPTGYAADPGDCDDTADAIHPDAQEVCDTLDNDCDGTVDEADAIDASTWYTDADGDGFGTTPSSRACSQPSGYADNNTDCNDTNDIIYPGSTEVCDGDDNDCDGTADESDATDASTWYADADSDGYGNASRSTAGCSAPSGYVSDKTDCDDLNARSNPGAAEVCDGDDNDCDGTVDDGVTTTFYADSDGDGHGDPARTTADCSAPSGYVSKNTDCDDGNAKISPNATEVCDGDDNDCDGTADEGDAIDASTWYADADSDGYGDAGSSVDACAAPSNYVSDDNDCDDSDAAINPDEDEVCNAQDDDCDGRIDDDDTDVVGTNVWYADADADGYGDDEETLRACDEPSGYVSDGGDCVDEDADLFPESDGTCPWGLTCSDILDNGRDDGDGEYTIDPDGSGGGLDPFDVYCDMTTDGGGWTEIAYDDDLDFKQHFTGGDSWRFLTSDFTFELSDAQIEAIQDLSTEGYQSYVGLCEHVIHYYYTSGTSYSYAFGFRFFDGTDTAYGSSSYSPYSISVSQDNCKSNGGEGGAESKSTIFEFDSVLVPVLNVRCRDCGDTFPEYFGSPLTDNPAWLR